MIFEFNLLYFFLRLVILTPNYILYHFGLVSSDIVRFSSKVGLNFFSKLFNSIVSFTENQIRKNQKAKILMMKSLTVTFIRQSRPTQLS